MKLGSFYLQMYALARGLIPDIADEYRAQDGDPNDDTPAMTLTIGADAEGWGYQTGDNSFTGGAYGYADWSVVTLFRDSDPHDIAEEIISDLCSDDAEAFEAIFPTLEPKANSVELEALRNFMRGKYHAGYSWALLMDDGGLVCGKCAREHYRQIFKATRDQDGSGWGVQAVSGSDSAEVTEACAECNAVLWQHEIEEPGDVYKLTAPSAWASYLINGDASGLDNEEELTAIQQWLASVNLGDPVDCTDAGFMHKHDAWEFWPFGSDCQTYTFIKREG